MSIPYFRCDNCNAEGKVHVLTKAVMRKEIRKVAKADPTTNKVVTVDQEVEIPETIKVKTMNMNTGKVEEIEIPKTEDLELRIHLIKFRAGQQSIQKSVCGKCLNTFQPMIKDIWNKFESIGQRK